MFWWITVFVLLVLAAIPLAAYQGFLLGGTVAFYVAEKETMLGRELNDEEMSQVFALALRELFRRKK